MGNANAFIQKKQSNINIHANELKSSEHDTIHYVGTINQNDPPSLLAYTPLAVQETTLPHREKDITSQQSIFGLSWLNCAPNISTPAIATFNISGYKKRDRGYVIIYQCTAKEESLINWFVSRICGLMAALPASLTGDIALFEGNLSF